MKEESVLNLLMYLFKYHMHDSLKFDNPHVELVRQLEQQGFQRPLINAAFDWLDSLGEQTLKPAKPHISNALRIFSDEECLLIDKDCRGFLIFLEHYGILKPHTREMVISQVVALKEEVIDLHLIKWVTLMVLFTQPEEKSALALMEFLVMEDQKVMNLH